MNRLYENFAQLIDADDVGLFDIYEPTGNWIFDVVLPVLFASVAIVSIVFVIIGGLRFTISVGKPDEIKKAKDTILYAVVGLVVSILSFAIFRAIVGAVGSSV